MQETIVIFLGSLILIFLIVVAAYYMSLVNKDKILNADYILGNWRREGVDSEGEKWWFEFAFDEGKVYLMGIPQFEAEGDYIIVKEDENLLTLALKNMKGDMEQDFASLMVAVDKKRGQLTIDQRSGYKRVS